MKIFCAPGHSIEWQTEVSKRAGRLAAAAKSGQDFLLLPVSDTTEAALWILASFVSPVVVVPVPGNLPAPALAAIRAQLPADRSVMVSALTTDTAPAAAKALAAPWVVLFSSGSTGEPKGIALHGEALRLSAEAHAAHNGSRDAHWLLNLPLFHVGGLSVLSRAHFLAAPVSLAAARFDANETLNWIATGGVSGLSVVPTTLTRLLDAPNARATLTRLRLALLGGAPATPELLARAEGLPIHRTYGLTENASQAATEKHPGSGLRPLPGVDIRIDLSGEIHLRSPFLGRGIYRHGVLHALPLTEGFYATGDLGEWQNGALAVAGRKGELMISGGLNIFPAEIETAAAGCAELGDFAVTSIDSPEWGEVICAAWTGSATPDTVKTHLASRLDPRKVPRRWQKLDAIPRSATGKVLRAALKLSFES